MTALPASVQVPALLLRAGAVRCLLPLERVERLYPMVSLPAAPDGVQRVHLRGETLPVVDMRVRWHQAPAEPHPSQRLVVTSGPVREVWWVDETGPISEVTPGQDALVDGQVIQVLW